MIEKLRCLTSRLIPNDKIQEKECVLNLQTLELLFFYESLVSILFIIGIILIGIATVR